MSTVAAISTPVAAGGIGMIRISGEDAIGIASRCFRPVSGRAVTEMRGYTAAYGVFFDEEGEIDDGVLLIYRAPKSYTGEDVAELNCHGGLFLLQKVLRCVLALGAAPAGPVEFTKRAFLNGKMDLSQAESVMNVIRAQGEQALSAARAALRGSVSREADGICAALIGADAALAAWADYPDEDIPAVDDRSLEDTLENCRARLQTLIRTYDRGKAVTEGVETVICGKPNVGKSTLMNLLSGCERSIVTPVAGTTRDVIEETVRVGDLLLRLSDTAGIRDTEDAVESIGVRRAKEKADDAALVLLVFDRSRPLDDGDRALLAQTAGKTRVAVINKCDLPPAFSPEALDEEAIPYRVCVSAKDPNSLAAIQKALQAALGTDGMDFTQTLLAGERQRDCCRKALTHVEDALSALRSGVTADAVTVDIDCAVDALLTLTGKKAGEAVVEEVFRRFCVGK